MANSKAYSISIDQDIFEQYVFICKECNINRSKYIESMLVTFIKSVKEGRFDEAFLTSDGVKMSDKLKKLYEKTM